MAGSPGVVWRAGWLSHSLYKSQDLMVLGFGIGVVDRLHEQVVGLVGGDRAWHQNGDEVAPTLININFHRDGRLLADVMG